jgi:hypothetical protein
LFNLHWNKIAFLLAFLWLIPFKSEAQQNLPLYDLKRAHFGFGIIANQAKLKTTLASDFNTQDSVRHVVNRGFPGIGIAGLLNIKISDKFDFRFTPGLTLTQRNIDFVFDDRKDEVVIETVSFDLPVLFKYKSERNKNTRFYIVGGFRYSHDFQSDEDTERGPFKKLVPIKKDQLSYEFGIGLDLYMEYFKFSPEIKMSNGINNVLSKDNYVYTNAFDGIFTRLLNITFFFE